MFIEVEFQTYAEEGRAYQYFTNQSTSSCPVRRLGTILQLGSNVGYEQEDKMPR